MEFDDLRCTATLENLHAVITYVETCAGRSALAGPRMAGLLIAVEEAFVNICHYGYPAETGEVVVACGNDSLSFKVEIRDKGLPFDPLSARPTQVTDDIMEQPVGGVGVLLMRKFCDEMHYWRDKGLNILRFLIRHAEDQRP